MSEFTKGEWKAIDGGMILGRCVGGCQLKEDTFMIAEVRGWGHLQYLGEGKAFNIQKANARLIAAAPELYVVSHNLAETIGIDYAIKKLSTMSDDDFAIGSAIILKGIQRQAKAALTKVEEKQ